MVCKTANAIPIHVVVNMQVVEHIRVCCSKAVKMLIALTQILWYPNIEPMYLRQNISIVTLVHYGGSLAMTNRHPVPRKQKHATTFALCQPLADEVTNQCRIWPCITFAIWRWRKSKHMWCVLCQKQVSRARTSDYIPRCMLRVIIVPVLDTCTWLWHITPELNPMQADVAQCTGLASCIWQTGWKIQFDPHLVISKRGSPILGLSRLHYMHIINVRDACKEVTRQVKNGCG